MRFKIPYPWKIQRDQAYLSILSMRFTFSPSRFHHLEKKNFQFSLWDSKELVEVCANSVDCESFNSLYEILELFKEVSGCVSLSEVLAFNSLYEIRRDIPWHRHVKVHVKLSILSMRFSSARASMIQSSETSFNSLYEIHWGLTRFELRSMKYYFQFSLWDSKWGYPGDALPTPACFQFSLWDSFFEAMTENFTLLILLFQFSLWDSWLCW